MLLYTFELKWAKTQVILCIKYLTVLPTGCKFLTICVHLKPYVYEMIIDHECVSYRTTRLDCT